MRSLLASLVLVVATHAQIDPALLAGMKARAIGPAGMSGRIAAIDALPGDPSLVYVGAATGGLWRSTNGGLTWKPVFDEQPVLSIGAVTIDPNNRDVVWVGTGEGNPRNSVSVGNGAFRSIDGGETWSHVGLQGTERIHRLLVDPRNGNVAYAGALGRLWGAGPTRGVFKTEDAGKTWRKVLYVDETTGCADLVMDPRNPNKLIAAMWQHRRWPHAFKSGGPGSGLYLSWDAGETWQKLGPADGLPAGELGRMGIAICRGEPDVVYALVEAKKNVLLRSDDGGRKFRTVNETGNVAPRPFYYCDIRVDPVRPDRVYSLHSLVTVSDDGGRTFQTLVPFRDVHPDHHALWIDPTDPRRLLLGNDGGVAESLDRGNTWRFVANLPVGQFYHLDVDLDVPYHVYGGMQDNGSWRGPADLWENGGIRNQHWDEVGFGDGFRTLPDPKDSMQGYAMSQGGELMRWDLRTGERKSIKPAPHGDEKLRFNWNAGIAQDPFDPAAIYFGSQFVHYSKNRGESWAVISPDLTTNRTEWQDPMTGGLTPDVTGAENFTTIITIAPSPKDRNVVWVGTDDGRVHVSRDGGGSWDSVEKNVPNVPSDTWVPHIEASPFDPAVAFLVQDDHRRSNETTYVNRTDDYGQTWRTLVTPTLRGYALTVVQDPIDPDLLFLGTEFGLYFSVDGGKAWQHFTHGLPHSVSVMALTLHPREHDLVIGTHGRAAFVIDDIRPLRRLDAGLLAKPLHVFEPGPAWQHTVRQTGGPRFPGHGEFRGDTRPYGALLSFSLTGADLPHPDAKVERERKNQAPAPIDAAKDAQKDDPKKDVPKVTVEVRDAQGVVIRTFKRPAQLGLNRLAWDLRRKGHKSPRRGDDDERGRRPDDDDEEPVGQEVLPGDYMVTFKFGDTDATAKVTVLADPRAKIDVADRVAKQAALERAGRLRASLAEVIEHIGQVRADLTTIDTKTKAATDDDAKNLRSKVKELRAALDAVEKRITTPANTKGIVESEHALSALGEAAGALGSSWTKPTAAQLRFLEIGEARATAAVAEYNAILSGPLAEVRALAAKAGASLVPARDAIRLDR